MTRTVHAAALLLLGTILLASGCRPAVSDGKVHVLYWEKWSGFEARAMQQVVDDFNRSQNRIVVEYLSMANVNRKTIVAIAGGDPPDIAGLWLADVCSFADNAALIPLDDFIRADGQTVEKWRARYYPVYADMTTYQGRTWAAVSTPSATALHWNKTLFRAAGLDPERPPRTLEELDEYAEKLTKRDPVTGEIVQLGFLPQEPSWFAWAYPQWFGGRLWDGTNITLGTAPENLACYRWVESYTRKIGLDQVRAFSSGFGNFASPQNPFMAGKVAMEFQGVWMNNYLRRFAPNFECGFGPWPASKPAMAGFALADADLLAIPRGAKHPREAWEFIRYVGSINSQAQTVADLRGMERLCYGQEKNSPLRTWSPAFEKNHPHPQIALFRQMSESPLAIHSPKIGIWQPYLRELTVLFEKARLLDGDVGKSVVFSQERVANAWDLHRRSLERREAGGRELP